MNTIAEIVFWIVLILLLVGALGIVWSMLRAASWGDENMKRPKC
jgi:hypothetical protein